MKVAQLLRALSVQPAPEVRAWDGPAWWGHTLGSRRSSGIAQPTLSESDAESLGAVYGCLSWISSTVSCMAVDVVEDRGGRPVPVPAPPVVVDPATAPQLTASMWLSQVVWSLRARGNAFGLVQQTSQSGWPTKVDILDPAMVRYTHTRGVDTWHVQGVDGRWAEVELWQTGGQLWHVPFGLKPGQTIGMDVLSKAAVDIGLASAARQYGADFFWSGGHPTAVLQSDQQIDRAQAEAVQERWDSVSASRGRSPRVLGAGLSYTPLQVTPDQVSLLGVMQASVADVCRWFDVPPEEIGGTSGGPLTYANIEGRGLQALRKLTPTIRACQDAWTGLLPAGLSVRLVPETLLLTNSEVKARVLGSNVRAGLMTVNEARALLDLAPVEGSDQLLWPPYRAFESAAEKEEV